MVMYVPLFDGYMEYENGNNNKLIFITKSEIENGSDMESVIEFNEHVKSARGKIKLHYWGNGIRFIKRLYQRNPKLKINLGIFYSSCEGREILIEIIKNEIKILTNTPIFKVDFKNVKYSIERGYKETIYDKEQFLKKFN